MHLKPVIAAALLVGLAGCGDPTQPDLTLANPCDGYSGFDAVVCLSTVDEARHPEAVQQQQAQQAQQAEQAAEGCADNPALCIAVTNAITLQDMQMGLLP